MSDEKRTHPDVNKGHPFDPVECRNVFGERCDAVDCVLPHQSNVLPDPATDAYRYPHVVKGSDVAAFLLKIGVDPVDLNTMRSLHIDPEGVTFVRHRVAETDDGRRRPYVTGKHPNADVAKQTTTCRIAWDE
jgi:hypothetical protein